tara:strand:+ start:6672 stop:7352 length:681 start_codon:yes stop_codon:yes gene_type:complete
MPIPLLIVAAPLIIGGIQKAVMNNKATGMENDISSANGVVTDIMNNRADVYDGSDKIRAMKDLVSNPYANLGVATQAAEMQAEEADIALANTLDTLRASGAGAGGATALAQAALKSKQGVSASIEQQEAQNQKLRAQGEQQKQSQLINIESQAISAEERAAAGEDARSQAELDRAYGEVDFLRSRQLGLEDAGDAALMAGISGTTSALGSGLGAGGAFTADGGYGN